MTTFVPYEKLSKKKKREIDSAKRGSWNGINPATRKSENPKAYRREKTLKWKEDSFQGLSLSNWRRGDYPTILR